MDVVEPFLATAPVDLHGIADALGIRVEPFFGWADDISGSIERAGGRYLIKINGRNAAPRRRFTLAHEIAHYVLHRDRIGDGITDDILYRSNQPGFIETEANQYAAGILMPASLIQQEWRQGLKSCSAIATKFDVSPRAAEIRLKGLKLV